MASKLNIRTANHFACKGAKVELPTDYEAIFRDRTLIITGTGRSGTTILGQLVATMRPVVYVFEPAVLRVGVHYETRAVLFEDFIIPKICGRVNPNPYDWTFWGNTWDGDELLDRQANVRRRSDALQWIETNDPLFVIKEPEFQHLMPQARKAIPGVLFIHLIRNGLEVVGSAVRRGWFTDDYQPIDRCYPKTAIPLYADPPSPDLWQKWNAATRAAHVWRTTTIDGRYRCGGGDWGLHYSDMCSGPELVVSNLRSQYGLRPTALTWKAVDEIINHDPQNRPASIDEIMEPEREHFADLMTEIGYDV